MIRWAQSPGSIDRASKALSIEIIRANSSQAKGRVERANKTLHDRLVKELRLAGVSTMDDGNAFLPAFMADYNNRFAKAPFNDKDLHRPMQTRDRLDEAFTWRAERTLSQSLTLHYDNILFMIEPSEFAQAAIGRRVEVVDFPDGRLEVRYKAAACPTAPSTSCGASPRRQCSRTSASAACSP